MVNEYEGHNQQDDVDAGNPGTKVTAKNVAQNDGKTRNGSNDQFAGDEKIIDGSSSDHHTKGHDDQFFPKLECFHIVNSFVDFCSDVTHLS